MRGWSTWEMEHEGMENKGIENKGWIIRFVLNQI